MLELTLGAIAAALIAKALGRAEDKALDGGEGAVRRLVQLVRGRLSGPAAEEGSEALERLEGAPGDSGRIEALARLVDAEVERDPRFRLELDELVEEAQRAGLDLRSTVQNAYGPQSPQFADIRDSEIQINFGSSGSDRPRRISD